MFFRGYGNVTMLYNSDPIPLRRVLMEVMVIVVNKCYCVYYSACLKQGLWSLLEDYQRIVIFDQTYVLFFNLQKN